MEMWGADARGACGRSVPAGRGGEPLGWGAEGEPPSAPDGYSSLPVGQLSGTSRSIPWGGSAKVVSLASFVSYAGS